MVTMMPQDVSGTLLTPKRGVGLKIMLIKVGVTQGSILSKISGNPDGLLR